VLKKLTATGILAAAATGVMLFGGSASADRISGGQASATIDPCAVTVPSLYQPPAWCNTYAPAPYYPPPAYYPPSTYYPGGYNYGWNRWHHNPYHWHR
jgi:hypothetical protein